MSPKFPRQSLFTTRKLVMPEEINPNGSLFGGVLMSWMDMVAYMSAQRHAGRPHVVTVHIDSIEFKHPLKIGDHVLLSSQVEHVGRTSMDIHVWVEREDAFTEERTPAATATLTFVALDELGKPTPVPPLRLETEEDQRHQQEARVRIKVRKRLKRWLERRLTSEFNAEAQAS